MKCPNCTAELIELYRLPVLAQGYKCPECGKCWEIEEDEDEERLQNRRNASYENKAK